jgi:uncharacterized membrane protein (DUF4010 family)
LDRYDGKALMLTPLAALERLLVAVLIGALIGLDRERAEVRKSTQVFAGVRTFPLIALAGAVPMLVFDVTGPALLVTSFLTVVAITLISYVRTSASGKVGATTEIAALVTFLLGVLAGAGQLLIAGATGIGVAVLLVAKPRLEAFSRALTSEELAAALELAVLSGIILPLLPDQGYGPWQILNPYEIWLVVVLVSGLSFAGFVAVRLLGTQRGLMMTGVIGALVSSTAVTVAMAERSRTDRPLAAQAAAGAILASTIMGVRVSILSALIDVYILPRLLPVIVSMVIVGVVASWILIHKAQISSTNAAEAKLSNPFRLMEALLFAGVYVFVLLVAKAGQEYLGARGMYVAAALSSLADVDAVTIAFTHVGSRSGEWQTPAAAVTIAVVTNTLVKLGIAVFAGVGKFRWYVGGALAVMAVMAALVGMVVFTRF